MSKFQGVLKMGQNQPKTYRALSGKSQSVNHCTFYNDDNNTHRC